MAPFMLVPLAQNISADNIISKRQAETSEVEIIATKIEPHRYYSYRGRNSNMSGNNKSQVLFKESMDNSLSYPQNLIHTSHFDYALKAYTGRILGLKDDLFHHTKQLVWITELQIDKDVFVPYGKDKTKQLVEGSLNESGVDPRCRYIHIQSDSNRGPLGCDQNQLCRILTHHQVSPSFLDILLTFSRCETPSPYCMFRRESHLSDEKSEHSIPSLGRSGVQFEHSFNLLSVEESNPEEGSPWSVRRTGAYNSFDVVDNRSVWIVLKGNRLIRKRLDAEAASHRHMKGSVLQTREGTLRSILATHLLIMEWAVEKWHPYIAYLEKKATKGSNVSITAPIDQEAEDEPAMVQSIASPPPSRRGTFRSRTYSFPRRIPSGLTEKEDSGYSSMGLQKIPSGEPSPELQQKFSWKAISAVNGQSLNSPGTLQPPASVEEPADVNPEYANLERVLTFDAIQHLNYVRKEMAEAIQAIEQNLSIFKEIKKYYTELQTLDDFEAHMDPAESRTILAKFFSRLGSLQSDLEKTLGSLKMQLGCLDSELKMRYSAIQFKGAKWSQHFAVTGHQVTTEMASWTAEMAETTTRMHTIAEKTEQETVSMHFITVLTLIFLPGTFLAVRFGAPALELISQMAALTFGQTFFSSGIFHWDEDTKVDSEYQVRGSGLALFGMICLPLTAVVMLIWVAVYKRCWTWIRRKPQETASTDVEKGELPQNMATASRSRRTSWPARTHSDGKPPYLSMSAPVAMGTIDTALPDNPTPYEEFSEWVNKHCTPGRLRPEWPKEVKDGAPRVPSMKEAFFVRPADQKKYWTNGKIAEIINDVTTAKQLPAPRAIQRSYIQTFSTLVTACLVPYLNMFVTYQIDDSRMPLSHFPPEWDIKNEMHNSLFGQLKKYQWKFFPQIFDVNMVKSCLDERIILPIEKCERIIIHEDDRHFASTVFRIEVEQSCHHFTSNVYCPFHISSISPLFLDESTALMVTVLQNDERKPSATPNVFALKVYDRETESDQFQREYAALNLLQNRNRNVISFFASFVQGDSSNIIEEYANGGNLWAFFENHDPPANPEDILAFWNSMFKILKGVQTIHSIEMAPRVGAAYFCIHGDLKLDNILRHKAQGSSSNFCFEPKIADFGNADVPKLRSDGEEMGRNQECDPAYSAPERNRTARFLWRSPMSVSRAIDIFSLGCIFTEACVWAVHGCDAFEKFFNKRSADTSPALKDAGYEGCFYDFKDGECNIISYVLDVLKTISGMEVVYLQHRITAKVARIVLQSMLMPNARDRDTIEVLISRFASILEDTKIQAACPKKASVPVPASSRTTSSPELLGSQHTSLTPRIMPQLDCSDTSSGPLGIGFVTDRATSPRQALASATFSIRKDWKRLFFSERIEPTELPSLSVDQVLEYRDKMQNTYGRRNPDAAVKRIVKKLQKYLDNRDQIFFLDDSRSMEKHREDVERTFEALGWIAEGIDDDGIDLFFGDPGSKKLQSGNSRELLEELKKHKYSPTSSNMVKSRLSHLVETELRERLVKLRQTHRRRSLLRLHRRKMPRINVFVFTDGNWVGDMDHTKAAGVDEPVRDLMDMIKELGLSQQDVTIQFVRFGNDKDGIQRLQYLDNFADNTELGNDLVDTEPANGNVYKMFMSSLDREIDLQVTNPLEGYDTEINSSNQTWYTAQESLSRVGSMGRDLEMV